MLLNTFYYELNFIKVFEGYSDANWFSDSLDIKFTSAYIFIFDENVMSYRLTK